MAAQHQTTNSEKAPAVSAAGHVLHGLHVIFCCSLKQHATADWVGNGKKVVLKLTQVAAQQQPLCGDRWEITGATWQTWRPSLFR